MIEQRFFSALARVSAQPGWGGLHRLPDRLAHSAALALRAAAAGMILTGEDGFPYPLAASASTARAAELVEFDAGEGPLTHLAATGEPVDAGYAVIDRCWPFYAGLLQDRAPFTRTVAVLIPGLGAMAVYDHPTGEPSGEGAGTTSVQAGLLAHLIGALLTDPRIVDQRAWSQLQNGDRWARRTRVITAAGMVMATLHLDMPTAVAVLRGHAFRTGVGLQDTADAFVDRKIEPEQLLL